MSFIKLLFINKVAGMSFKIEIWFKFLNIARHPESLQKLFLGNKI